MKCAAHPKVDTNLRCGKCEKPICPKCMVYTPVGARCKDCAQLKRLPMFDVTASQYALAAALGAFLALVVGFVWALLAVPFIAAFIPLGVGYLIGEVISLSVNRKRSAGLQIIAGLSVVATYIFSRMIPYLAASLTSSSNPFNALLLLRLGALIVVGTVSQPFMLVFLALGIYLGITRLR